MANDIHTHATGKVDMAAVAGMSRSEMRAWAETEVEEVHRILANSHRRLENLHAILNYSAPVNQLSDELLVEIIRNVKHGGSQLLKQWIGTTHVCHRWRVAVLNAPLLWNMIHFDRHHIHGELDMAQLCLRRSKNAFLQIRVDTGYIEHAMQALIGEEHRIASLRLVELVDRGLSRLARNLGRMVNLETLELLFGTYRSPYAEDTLPLPAECAARLRTIRVRNIFLQVVAPLSNLTYLEIDMSICTPNCATWPSLLRRCPRLVSLYLKHTQQSTHSQIAMGGVDPAASRHEDSSHGEGFPQRVTMRELRTLKLELPSDHMSSILDQFAFPQATHMSLIVLLKFPEPPTVPAVVMLRQMANAAVVSSIQRIRVVLGDRFSLLASPIRDEEHNPLLRFVIFSQPERRQETAPLLIREMMSTFSLSPLMSLDIQTTWIHTLDESLCLELLRRCPLLEKLRVGGIYGASPVLAALRQRATSAVHAVVCSGLKVVEIYVPDLSETVNLVLDVLRCRNAQGSRLKELHLITFQIDESSADPAVTDQLKQLVDVLKISYSPRTIGD